MSMLYSVAFIFGRLLQIIHYLSNRLGFNVHLYSLRFRLFFRYVIVLYSCAKMSPKLLLSSVIKL